MADNNGYISVDRRIMSWQWYKNADVFRIFIHVLLSANHKEGKWEGHVIKRGEFVTSSDNLSKILNISRQSVRTSLSKLKLTGEITIKSTNKFSIITICKYDTYQSNGNKNNQQGNNQDNQQSTSNQPTTNQQLTTNNNDNNNNKEISSIEQRMKKFGQSLSAFQDIYTRDMLQSFYDYWREPNTANTKMKFEFNKTWNLSLRLNNWKRNDDNNKPQPKKIDWQVEKFNFLNDDTWRMRISQEYKASKEQFDSCISCFIKDIEDKDDYKDVAGLKKHFINHIKKNGVDCKKQMQAISSSGSSHIPNYDTPEKLAALLDKYK